MPRSTPADQLLGARAVRVGLQRDVGHPLHRDVSGRVGERAAVGAAEPFSRGHLPVQLVADQRAAGDDVELLLGHALVVVADGGQAVVDEPVAGDEHLRAAVLQGAQLVERWRTRCRRTPPRSPAPGPARWRGRSTRGWSGTGWTGGSPGRSGRPRPTGRRPGRPAAPASRRPRRRSPSRCRSGTPSPGRSAAAVVRMVAKPWSPTLTAVSWAWIRTRCWVVVVPARLAKYLFSCTYARSAVGVADPAARPAAPRSARSIRPTLSASSTSNGLTSYADTQVASA